MRVERAGPRRWERQDAAFDDGPPAYKGTLPTVAARPRGRRLGLQERFEECLKHVWTLGGVDLTLWIALRMIYTLFSYTSDFQIFHKVSHYLCNHQ